MFISFVEFEVARERHLDYIRDARAENQRKAVQGRRRFGRQADRMGQAAGDWVRGVITRFTPAGEGRSRHYA